MSIPSNWLSHRGCNHGSTRRWLNPTVDLRMGRLKLSQIVARHHAAQVSLSVENRVEALQFAALTTFFMQDLRQILLGKRIGQRHNVGAHSLAYEDRL